MDKTISSKMMFCNVVCTILVVLRHSLNIKAFFGSGQPTFWNQCIQNAFMNITSIAVPFFFLMSGFFFFKGEVISEQKVNENIIKRAKSLLIPFVVWGIINTLILQLSDSNRYGILDGFFFTHMWYVRDLMFFMLFTPIIAWLRHKTVLLQYVLLTILLILWEPVNNVFPSSEGALFFVLGCILNSRLLEVIKIPIPLFIILTLLWLWIPFYWEIGTTIIWQKIYIFAGVCLLWNTALNTNVSKISLIAKFSPFCFFIYCGHLYLLKAIKVSIAKYFGGNDILSIICFFLIPIIVMIVLFCIGNFMKKHTPKVYAVLIGYRKNDYMKRL